MLNVFQTQNGDKHQSKETKTFSNRIRIRMDPVLSVAALQCTVETLVAEAVHLQYHANVVAR